MKREIKFRGKRLDNGEWVYGNLLLTEIETFIIPLCQLATMHAEVDKSFMVDPSTVGQFTGLLDKNGKEIFEGDIVTCVVNNEFRYQHKGVVEYQIGYIGFAVNVGKDPNSESDEDFFSPMYLNVEFEIIGNIHEHPTLLSNQAKG